MASSTSLRAQLRRAVNKGVLVRLCAPSEVADAQPLRQELQDLVGRWMRTRHLAPLSFVASVQPFFRLAERRVFVAEVGDTIVGALFAIPIPAREAWLFDHIVRTPQAPNGTAELLVDGAMRQLAHEGYRQATLGLCPLAGRVPRVLSFIRRTTRGLFDFHGLYAFKAKLRPHRWQRVLVEHPGQSALLGTIRALRAFAGGSLLRFSWQTAQRGPPPLVRAIALLLIPWTLALLHPRAEQYFPSSWMTQAWAAFDVVVALALFRLAQRISHRSSRRGLHMGLAIGVTLDAGLTLAQALLWNLPRMHDATDCVIVAGAVLGPFFAASVLWSSLRFRET